MADTFDMIHVTRAREIVHRIKPLITYVPTLGILKQAYERLPNPYHVKDEYFVITVELQQENHQEQIDLDAPPNMPQTYTRLAVGKITFVKMFDNGFFIWVYIGPVKEK